MNSRPQRQSSLIAVFPAPRLATRKLMRERAMELAVLGGRPAHDVAGCDWEQAKRELARRPGVEHQVPGQIIFAAWTQ